MKEKKGGKLNLNMVKKHSIDKRSKPKSTLAPNEGEALRVLLADFTISLRKTSVKLQIKSHPVLKHVPFNKLVKYRAAKVLQIRRKEGA